eukprot:EG_transcript_40061
MARAALTMEDAKAYLDLVQTTLAARPEVYDQFLSVMKDFRAQQLTTPAVIARVAELFQGHPELTQGFNTFLPPEFKIAVAPPPSPAPALEAERDTGAEGPRDKESKARPALSEDDDEDDVSEEGARETPAIDQAILLYVSLKRLLKNHPTTWQR